MRWEDYFEVYQSYELSINQSRVLSIVAGEILEQFPNRLPKAIRKPLVATLGQLRDALFVGEPSTGAEMAPDSVEIDITHTHEIVPPVVSMYLARAALGASTEKVDFERALCSQDLVMLFAHLDAFTSDSLETICRLRPEVMRSRKTLEWDTILSYGGWENLLDHMIAEYVFQFGWQSVAERVKFLKERLGLTIDLEDSELAFLDEAEKARNIVVHNGGRANEEYIKRTGRTELTPGEFVTVTPQFLGEAFEVTRMLVSHIFTSVSKKFFGREDSELRGVWRPGGSSPAQKP